MKRAPLIRRAEKSRPWRRKDPTDPAERNYVIARDGCVAPTLGATDPCRDTWGNRFDPRQRPDLLEADHIRDEPMMGKRGKRMVGMCPWHHRLGNPPWATSNREAIREYLERVQPMPVPPCPECGPDDTHFADCPERVA